MLNGIDEITRAAQQMGITLTSAKDGTDIYQCWADRVQDAYAAWERMDMPRMREMIKEANNYAVK